MSEKVLVAMSGGVDSSVAAALLMEAGYETIAVTMRFGTHDLAEPKSSKPSCCSIDGIEDARRVAHHLGMPFYPINYESEFRETIIDYFINEYSEGRTPSPCILCNKELKFGKLFQLADRLSCKYVATGHYSRIEYDEANDRYQLLQGVDRGKDQSYFLFSMTQEQLSRTLMPLGTLKKSEVREIAKRHKLYTADKAESQELCFVSDGNYKRFLKDRIPEKLKAGDIVDGSGTILGKHEGIQFYTVGQRRGLGISASEPLYVSELRRGDNSVVVGSSDDLLKTTLYAKNCNFISIDELTEPLKVTVKIRYRDEGALATIFPADHLFTKICFDQPRRAITPGQAVVFYDGDRILGGGWITDEVVNNNLYNCDA